MRKFPRFFLLGSVISTAYSCLNAGILSIQQGLPFLEALMSSLVSYYILAFLSIPLWYFCQKRPFNKSRMARFFVIHLLGALLFSTVWIVIVFSIYRLTIDPFGFKMIMAQKVYLWQFLDGITKYGLLVGIFYTINFYKKFKEKELRETELGLLTKNMELQNLKSQINPHFLFNTLNSVNALMAKDPEKARTMNAILARLLRFSLDGYDKRFVTLKQELDFIRDYLDIEKVRLGNKLRVHEEIDPKVLQAEVPSMLLQPIVENAIKHGISKEAKEGRLEIHAFLSNGILNLEITNTGKPVSAASVSTFFDQGIGLKNTNARLKRLYGESFGLQFKSVPPNALSVIIKIPQNRLDQ